MVDAVLAGLPPGPDRIAALTLASGSTRQAPEILARADEEAQDKLTRGRVLDLLAYRADDPRSARRSPTPRGQGRTLACVITTRSWSCSARRRGRWRRSSPDGRGRTCWSEQPSSRDQACGWPLAYVNAGANACGTASWPRPVASSRSSTMTVRSGIEFQRPYRKSDLAMAEIAAGNVTLAAELADDGLESALDAGNWSAAVWVGTPRSRQRPSREHRARDARRRGVASMGNEHGEPPRLEMADHVAGVLALARGDPALAARHLEAGIGVPPSRPSPSRRRLRASRRRRRRCAAQSAERAAAMGSELDEQSATLDSPWVRPPPACPRCGRHGDRRRGRSVDARRRHGGVRRAGLPPRCRAGVLVAWQGVASLVPTGGSDDGAGRSERTVARSELHHGSGRSTRSWNRPHRATVSASSPTVSGRSRSRRRG